jgi:hypothetical protein
VRGGVHSCEDYEGEFVSDDINISSISKIEGTLIKSIFVLCCVVRF